jgi:osmotically inducible lipoprotein OsmB
MPLFCHRPGPRAFEIESMKPGGLAMTRLLTVGLVMTSLAMGLAGCGESRGTRAVTGGLLGAGAGAGVSAVTGGKPATGALVGGGVGAVGGAVTGR